MKKILVFGLPRSGTTLLQKRLSSELHIPNLNEPFNDSKQRAQMGDPYHWAKDLSAGVVKFLVQNLQHVNLKQLVEFGKFDQLVITQRHNFTDILISLYYAENISKQYHYRNEPVAQPFELPLEWVDGMMIYYEWFQQSLNYLNEESIPYTIFDYDLYCSNQAQSINGIKFFKPDTNTYKFNFVSANIDYKKICLNYIAINEKISQLIK